MAKYAHPDMIDGALNIIKNNATKMVVCTAQPTTYTEGNTTYKLAEVTMASGDFTIANGDSSGRKVTVAAKNGVPVTVTGSATHVALLDVTNSKVLFVTTCTTVTLNSGNTVNFPAWKDEIAAPA